MGKHEHGRVYDLDPRRVKPFADQPRKRFRGIKKLAESIRICGQVTPIEVIDAAEPEFDAELVDGERRLRACLTGGMRVKAIFSDTRSENRYVRSIAANFCRQGHDAVEIMEAVTRLKDAGRSAEEIAGIFGKSAAWVSQYASLRKLHPDVLEELKIAGDEVKQSRHQLRRKGRMTVQIALLLVGLPERDQVGMMQSIRDRKMSKAQAQTFVRGVAKKKGLTVGRNLSPAKRFRSLRTAVENCHHVVERYIDMPGREIEPAIRGTPRAERQELARLLDDLATKLLMFHDALMR